MPEPSKIFEKGTIASGAAKRFTFSNLFPSVPWEYPCQSEAALHFSPFVNKKPQQNQTTKPTTHTQKNPEQKPNQQKYANKTTKKFQNIEMKIETWATF